MLTGQSIACTISEQLKIVRVAGAELRILHERNRAQMKVLLKTLRTEEATTNFGKIRPQLARGFQPFRDIGTETRTRVPPGAELSSNLPPKSRTRSLIPVRPTPMPVPLRLKRASLSAGIPTPLSLTSRMMTLAERCTRTSPALARAWR